MKTAALVLLLALTAGRLWLAATLPVAESESFLWMCAQRWEPAFFDGPAGTATLVRAGIETLGDTPLGLRVAFPLCAALASLAAFLLGRVLANATAGIWAAVALNLTPAFQLAAVTASPLAPTLAFTLLGAAAAVAAFQRAGLGAWLLFGVTTGIAANFHYAAVAVLPAVALAFSATHRYRAEWRRPGLYAALALVVIALVPAFAWNQSNGWPAAGLGTLRTALTPNWSAVPAATVASAATLGWPLTAALLGAGIALLAAARHHVRPRLALALALPFALLAARDVLLGGAFPFAILAAGVPLAAGAADTLGRWRGARPTAAAALVAAAVLAAVQPPRVNPFPWARFAEPIRQLLLEHQPIGEPPLFVIVQRPDATAALHHALARGGGAAPEVFLRESQDLSNQFGLWPRYDVFVTAEKPADEFFKLEGNTANPYLGRSALYLTDEAVADLPQTITAAFGRVSPLAELDAGAGRKLRVYLCENYQTMPL